MAVQGCDATKPNAYSLDDKQKKIRLVIITLLGGFLILKF